MPDEQVLNLDQENESGCFKDAICINTRRIYDSCSDKDCMENLLIYFPDCSQTLINQALNTKVKSIDVIYTTLDVEHIPFNKGFYSVDITFYFKVLLSVTEPSIGHPIKVEGLSTFSKKVILFGSEGNIKTFSSDDNIYFKNYQNDFYKNSLPQATIQVSQPISLSSYMVDIKNNYLPQEKLFHIPKYVDDLFEGDFCCCKPEKIIYITIGLFSIVQLERKTQIMVPIYDFYIPDKECNDFADTPCEIFKKIKFPKNEFFPPSIDEKSKCND